MRDDYGIAPLQGVETDHMGRRKTNGARDALKADWPWIVALVLLMAFVIGALGGQFRF